MTLFALSPEETEVATTARAYFGSFVDNVYLNEQQASDAGFEAKRWDEMTELGWTGIHLPSRVGGFDGSLIDAALVLRESGRSAFASPLLPTLRTATALMALAGDDRYDAVLARIAEGSRASLIAAPDGELTATRSGSRCTLSGRPVVVEWLTASETTVLIVPSDDGAWICAALPTAQLVERSVDVASMDNERIARVDLEGLVLDEPSTGIAEPVALAALARADLLRASVMVGGTADVVDRTAQYAKERFQFGRAIGSFQAAQHHLARMVIARDGAQLLCDDALTRADIGREPSAALTAIALAARFGAGRAYVETVLTGAQLHGGIGTTIEHVLHHHFRRAKAMQLRCGRTANRLRELHQALIIQREGSLW